MRSEVLAVAFDCRDAEALAAFWCETLGYQVQERWTDARGVRYVEIGATDHPTLVFQPVSEVKRNKNRLHLDITPTDGSQTDEVKKTGRLRSDGALQRARLPVDCAGRSGRQ